MQAFAVLSGPKLSTGSSFTNAYHTCRPRFTNPLPNYSKSTLLFNTTPICGMSAPAKDQRVSKSVWEKLYDKVDKEDYINGPVCSTPTKERESFRLFGQKEADVRLVFYRDHAAWCPYCHKVQMLIEAKRIPYLIKKINLKCYGSKPVEFIKKVPSGLLPAIELDGKLITESMGIMFLIEETFQTPYKKMIPTEDNNMMQAFHRFLRLERVYMGAWLGSLRGPMAGLERGLEPVHQTLNMIENYLGEFEGSFFYPGDEPSFVDINFATLFERSRASLKYWRNLEITEGRPNLKAWFHAWESWPPAVYLRSDAWTHIGALPPQIGPVRFNKTRDSKSLSVETARLLHILNDGPERKDARHQAAAALCRNSELVTKDAIRGGKVPEKYHQYVDLALQVMVQVLTNPDRLEELEDKLRETIPQDAWKVVGNAIRFERIRCCAPRDMPIWAMEQFCGAINWFLRTLEQQLDFDSESRSTTREI